MKTVKLDKKYFVEVDVDNLTLKENKNKVNKKGVPVSVVIGYFKNWEHVFNRIIRLYVIDKISIDRVVEIKELKDIYTQVKNEIKELIVGLKEEM